MNNWKGTKGKWEIKEDFREPKIINESGQVLFTHNKKCYDKDVVRNLNVFYSHNKMIANAKLIAAAPDLLEALMSIENDKGIIPKAIWDMRNKAIEKALK